MKTNAKLQETKSKNSDFLKKKFIKSKDVVFRNIFGEYLLVPIKSHMKELDNIYSLNEVAARIWELINGKNNAKNIAECIIKEYETTADIAQKDTVQIIKQFKKAGIIKEQ